MLCVLLLGLCCVVCVVIRIVLCVLLLGLCCVVCGGWKSGSE